MKYRALLSAVLLSAAIALPAAAAALTATPAAQNNSAPIAENLSLTTYRGIAITSRFAAADPDGDPVTFRIVDSPARGQVTVDRNDTAAFWYTPYEGKKGKDSFTYVATDDKGNVSEPATVKIVIEKQSSKVTYSDMAGEAAAFAATRLAEENLYVGRKVGDLYCFDPGAVFTREEFLTLAMAAAGTQPLEGTSFTGFYDDEDISVWAKGYVSAALLEGTVQGSLNEQGQAVFRGGAEISYAEATVIIDRLLATGDVATPTTAAAPVWAAQSAANLEAMSVLSPAAQLNRSLTRSDAAQMLSAMLDVLERRETKGWLW